MAENVGVRKSYPILSWRPVWDIAMCYVPIAVSMALVIGVSWWFYPLAILVIANRLLALSLLCHEGLHGNLSSNRFWNNWIGRWICAYPSMISFSKYRALHHMHHWGIGSDRWDPDRNLYDVYPVSLLGYVFGTIGSLFTLRTAYSFMRYYVLPETARLRRPSLFFSGASDLLGFLFFHIIAFAVVIYFGWWWKYELLYVVPVTFVLQPYVILMGGLQHGPVRAGRRPETISRSIRGPKWLMEVLLPCDIGFHAEHHMNPAVPHYWLRQYAADLEVQGLIVWKSSYPEALNSLFRQQTVPSIVSSLEGV